MASMTDRKSEKPDELLRKLLGVRWPMAPDPDLSAEQWLDDLEPETRQRLFEQMLAKSKSP